MIGPATMMKGGGGGEKEEDATTTTATTTAMADGADIAVEMAFRGGDADGIVVNIAVGSSSWLGGCPSPPRGGVRDDRHRGGRDRRRPRRRCCSFVALVAVGGCVTVGGCVAARRRACSLRSLPSDASSPLVVARTRSRATNVDFASLAKAQAKARELLDARRR